MALLTSIWCRPQPELDLGCWARLEALEFPTESGGLKATSNQREITDLCSCMALLKCVRFFSVYLFDGDRRSPVFILLQDGQTYRSRGIYIRMKQRRLKLTCRRNICMI